MIKKILIGLLIVFVVLQFFRIDKTQPDLTPEKDIVIVEGGSDEIKAILKANCYDCHSNEVVYPWYSNIAPISWLLADHIEEAREHVNFSVWADYDAEDREEILGDSHEEVEEGEMPLSGYAMIHGDMSESDREMLEEWFEDL